MLLVRLSSRVVCRGFHQSINFTSCGRAAAVRPNLDKNHINLARFYGSARNNMAAKLRLVQFASGGEQKVGVEVENGGSVVDITAVDSCIPKDMRSFLEGWESNLSAAERLIYCKYDVAGFSRS